LYGIAGAINVPQFPEPVHEKADPRLVIMPPERRVASHVSRGDAQLVVVFQVAFGTFHIDVFIGCELRTDPIIRSGTGLDVPAEPKLKDSFQIFAN